MTRDYYNLLEKTENDSRQSYIWDGNVVGIIDGDNTSIDYGNNIPDTIGYGHYVGEEESTY